MRTAMPWTSFLASALLSLLSATAAISTPATQAPALVTLLRLPQAAGETSTGFQFVQADSAGNGLLLDGDALEVRELSASGALGSPQKLEVLRGSRRPVLGAARSLTEDAWLLFMGNEIHLVRNLREKPLPLPGWLPHAVGFRDGAPLLAVAPFQTKASAGQKRPTSPPLVLELVGEAWRSLFDQGLEPTIDDDEVWNSWYVERALLTASDGGKGVWLANEFGYRLRRLSPSGRLLQEIVVDSGRPAKVDEAAAEAARQAFLKQAQKEGASLKEAEVAAVTLPRRFLALAPGIDGRLYALVTADGEGKNLRLDRFDGTTQELRRVELALPGSTAIRSMAALREGLVLAGARGDHGRWFVSWEELEAASWKPVPNAEVRQ